MTDNRQLNMIVELGNILIQQGKQIAKLIETVDSINEIYSHREYTVKEAAQILNRSDSTIHRWIKEGSMPYTPKADGSIVITKHNIDEYHGRINARTRARDRKNGQNGTYDGTHAGKVKTFSEG